jgi:hypothetical protein
MRNNDNRQAWARWAATWAILAFVTHFVFAAVNSTSSASAASVTIAANTIWITGVFVALTVVLLGWGLMVRYARTLGTAAEKDQRPSTMPGVGPEARSR